MPIMSSGDIAPGTGKVTFPDNAYGNGTTGINGSSTSSNASTSSSETISISGQNIGTPDGVGIFANVIQADPTTFTLTFKNLVAGNGIAFSATDETITITATGASGSGNSGIVSVNGGGTGLTSIAQNQMLIGNGSNVLSLISAPNASNEYLYFDGTQISWQPFVIQASNILGLAAVATSGSYTDLANIPEPYVLPPATMSTLGGIAVGNGLAVDSNGILSADVISVNGQTGVVTLTAAQIGAISASLLGVSNGVASLDVNGKIPYSELPESLLGSLAYKGTWNANTNTPDILTGSASSANNGWFYIVDTAGLTVVDGNTNWQVGYWIISNGTVWNQIQSTSEVTSVNGQVGAVEITAETLGLATVATSGSYTDLINLPETTLPLATTTTLGGVIVGNGLNIASNGVLSIGNEFGEGIVQSVALSLPSIFAVNGSPVTSTGTLKGVLLSQPANTFFSGPASGSADIPTFRKIVSADLPVAGSSPGAVSVGAGLSVNTSGVLSADMQSFNGRTGQVSFQASDMIVPYVPGVINPLAGTFLWESPIFAGNPTAPTPAAGDNSTAIATTAFVTNYVDSYSLPIATDSSLGGIIAGSGLTVASNGTLSANVQSFDGRTGNITLQPSDLQVPYVEGVVNPLVGTFLWESPIFAGTPTAPTPSQSDSSTRLATTAFVTTFVEDYVNDYNLPIANTSSIGGVIVGSGLTVTGNGTISANVTSVAGQTGDITLSIGNISGGAPIASPTFQGSPTVPTAPTGDSSTLIANTAFVTSFVEDYVNDYNLPAATISTLGGIVVGNGLAVTDNGTLSANVLSYQGRTGNIVIESSDLQVPYVEGVVNPLAGTFILTSPEFTGTPTAPTPAAGNSSTQIATTAFVTSYVNDFSMPPATTSSIGGVSIGAGLTVTSEGSLSANVLQVNGQTGNITLSYADVNAAPLVSPAFTGTPTTPTPQIGDNTETIATTAFVQSAIGGYTSISLAQLSAYTLPASTYGVPNIILGGLLTSDVTLTLPTTGKWSFLNETSGAFNVILASNTGPTVTAPQGGVTEVISADGIYLANQTGVTRPFDDSSTFLATTEFVATALGSFSSGVTTFNGRAGAITFEASDLTGVGGALIASPTFTGIPAAPTAAFGTNTTQIATTAFVTSNYAPLSSPVLTGTPTAPTPAAGDNSQNIATTSFVDGALSAYSLKSSPAFTGTPTAPTQPAGDDSNNLATTAFVQNYLSNTVSVNLSLIGQPPQSPDMTLTAAQYSAEIINFVGAPTVSMTITVPASGQWMMYNNATGTNSVSLTNGMGAVYELPQFQSAIVMSLGELGVINANIAGNFITPATASTIGGVIIPNGSGLSVDQDGNLSVSGASSSTIGGVMQGAGVTITDSVLSANVLTVAGRTGNIVLSSADLSDVSNIAFLASPALTGTPTAPTAAAGTHTTQIANTAFVTTAISNAATASGFAPLASPAFTGTPTAPTATSGTSSTQIATTAFVATNYAPIASPVLTGTPQAPTPATGDNSQNIATTSFVTTAITNAEASYAPIASPTFTGRVTTVSQEYDVSNLGSVSGTVTLNLTTATEWTMTIAGATTFAFANDPGANLSQVVFLRLTNGGSYSITWPTSTLFPSGTAPTLTTLGIDVLGLKYDPVSSTFMVFVVGLNLQVL
jgi:hypothetical protein